MGQHQIFKPQMELHIDELLAGKEVIIWRGYHHEMTLPWSGRITLKIKVKKRKRLINGLVLMSGDGWDDRGDLYTASFKRLPTLIQKILES